MLVLSRKLNEKIQIGEDVSITVLEIKGNKVRIGIAAPRDVRVLRSELPPKQPNTQPKLAVTSEDSPSEDLAFIPMRKNALDYHPGSAGAGVNASDMPQSRLMEIRQAANRRRHFPVVASETDSSPRLFN